MLDTTIAHSSAHRKQAVIGSTQHVPPPFPLHPGSQQPPPCHPPTPPPTPQPLPPSYAFGQAARRLRLPQITGYLVSGILCGPYVLKILSVDGVSSLSVIEGACLGVIGLAAGAELHLSELARSKRAVVSISIAICLSTWVLCYTVLSWTSPVMPPLVMLNGPAAAAALLAAADPAAAAAAAGAHAAAGAGAAAAAGVPAAAVAAMGAADEAADAAHAREAVARRLSVAVASLGATLMMARSPASAVSVLGV